MNRRGVLITKEAHTTGICLEVMQNEEVSIGLFLRKYLLPSYHGHSHEPGAEQEHGCGFGSWNRSEGEVIHSKIKLFIFRRCRINGIKCQFIDPRIIEVKQGGTIITDCDCSAIDRISMEKTGNCDV